MHYYSSSCLLLHVVPRALWLRDCYTRAYNMHVPDNGKEVHTTTSWAAARWRMLVYGLIIIGMRHNNAHLLYVMLALHRMIGVDCPVGVTHAVVTYYAGHAHLHQRNSFKSLIQTTASSSSDLHLPIARQARPRGSQINDTCSAIQSCHQIAFKSAEFKYRYCTFCYFWYFLLHRVNRKRTKKQ